MSLIFSGDLQAYRIFAGGSEISWGPAKNLTRIITDDTDQEQATANAKLVVKSAALCGRRFVF
jgi:hypothetical protein